MPNFHTIKPGDELWERRRPRGGERTSEVSTPDHLPDAGKMMPTEQDYKIDMAADLETIRPLGAPIDAEALDLLLRYASKNYGPWDETEGIRSNRKFLPDYGDGAALALACEWADSWLRRAQAAEAAILDLDRAWSADAHEPGLIDRLEIARSDVKRIAARIRAGREKGAQP